MNDPERRIAEHVFLDYFIAHAKDTPERAFWEREQRRRGHSPMFCCQVMGDEDHDCPRQVSIPGLDDARAARALKARDGGRT